MKNNNNQIRICLFNIIHQVSITVEGGKFKKNTKIRKEKEFNMII